MDDQRVGSVVRAVRRRRGLRQADVGALAHVDQTVVSRMERGHLDELSLGSMRRIAAALDIQLPFQPRWRGGELDRLLDRDHALVVELVAKTLRRFGWEVTLEVGFNFYGDRGSVDIVGWRSDHAALLLVEVKTRLVDLQDLLAAMDRKRRAVPRALERDRAWPPKTTSLLLVAVGTTTNRAVVATHPAVFATSFPDRWADLRPWLAEPRRQIHALWMISPRRVAPVTRRGTAPTRVRKPSGGRTGPP